MLYISLCVWSAFCYLLSPESNQSQGWWEPKYVKDEACKMWLDHVPVTGLSLSFD